VRKPKRSFQAVVRDLIDGFRAGDIQLRDEPARASPVPGAPRSARRGGGASTAPARPPAGPEVTTRGIGEG
jgi:hypothetical protein